MDRLSAAMSLFSKAKKRSFVDAFLHEEAAKPKVPKKSTSIELARAKERKDTLYQNMVQKKERVREEIAELREVEAAYEAASEDVQRLKILLRDDE